MKQKNSIIQKLQRLKDEKENELVNTVTQGVSSALYVNNLNNKEIVPKDFEEQILDIYRNSEHPNEFLSQEQMKWCRSQGNRTIEHLPDLETIEMLYEIKRKNLVKESEIKNHCDKSSFNYSKVESAINSGLIYSIPDHIFEEYERGNLSALTQAQVSEKNYFVRLDKTEVSFLEFLRKNNIETKEELLSHANLRGVSQKRLQEMEKNGVIDVLYKNEIEWLRAVEEGRLGKPLGVKELQGFADELGIKNTWNISRRISIDVLGKRTVDIAPKFLKNDYYLKINQEFKFKESEEHLRYRCRQGRYNQNISFKDIKELQSVAEFQTIRKRELELYREFNHQKFLENSFHSLSKKEIASILQGDHFIKVERSKFKDLIPENKEYYALQQLKGKSVDDIEEVLAQYNVSLESLKEKKLIDYLSSDEIKYIKNLNKLDAKEIDRELLLNPKFKDLEERGFINQAITENDKNFLRYIKDNSLSKEREILAIADKFMIDEKRLNKLVYSRRLDFLRENEEIYLKAVEKGATSQELQNISKSLEISAAGLHRRIEKTDKAAASVNLKAEVNLGVICNTGIKVSYSEDSILGEYRKSLENNYKLTVSAKDSGLYYKSLNSEHLTNKEKLRLQEITNHSVKEEEFYIPNNNELFFLQSMNGRKFKENSLDKASQEHAISKEKLNFLITKGYLEIVDNKLKNNWHDTEEIQNFRIIKSLENIKDKGRILKALGIKANALRHYDIESENSKLIKPGLKDFELGFKVRRGEALNAWEDGRLKQLRVNGHHPESKDWLKWEESPQKSWRMQQAQRKAFLNDYQIRNGVDVEKLQFINTFKQASHKALLELGISEADIDIYVKGEKRGDGKNHKLLERHVLPGLNGEDPIVYYSLTHTGLVSARGFLEQVIDKKDIKQRPQQRHDLLHHDLKVVESVLDAIQKKKEEGYVLKSVKHESEMISEYLQGRSNEDRKEMPTFFDAYLEFEELEQSSGSVRSHSVAVEYGNYEIGEMTQKIDNAVFDEAMIYSNAEYQQKYVMQIKTQRNVSFYSI